jgi:hypothetical protein
MSVSRLAATLLVALATAAHAQAPAATPAAAATPAPAPSAAPTPPAPSASHADSPIAQARERFDFGDYAAVIAMLGPLVENDARDLPLQADRIEALRVYGIACVLTDRRVAAEGAFLLLLREEPSTQFDPRLVRPEAVAFFEDVRVRHRAELLAVYRKTRPRYHWFLNLIPTVGQFQNRQPTKGFVFGGVELALLGGYVTSYALLTKYGGGDHTFTGHDDVASLGKPIEYTCYILLLGVTAAGIIDGFVVGARRQRTERLTEQRLGL